MIAANQACPAPLHLMTRRVGDAQGKSGVHPSSAGAEATKRVAIVEDEAMVAWMLESMLEDLGHEVVGIFPDGEHAIAALRHVEVDLICMDVNLGSGIDGIEAARRIRESQPTAILFVTAYSDIATKQRIQESTPGAVLVGKPTSLTALEKAIGITAGH